MTNSTRPDSVSQSGGEAEKFELSDEEYGRLVSIETKYKTARYTLLNTTKVDNTSIKLTTPAKTLRYKVAHQLVGLE